MPGLSGTSPRRGVTGETPGARHPGVSVPVVSSGQGIDRSRVSGPVTEAG